MKQNNLVVSIGKKADGKEISADFFKMGHLLIGGQAGSGKSNFILNLISQLKSKSKPEELRLILADPKQAELLHFKKSPYLLMPIIFHTYQTIIALDWLVAEMERRFEVLNEARTMNIKAYNKKFIEKMPHIFFIADEFSDFMLSKERGSRKIIEEKVINITQMGKAVGIHLVIATSRTSPKVFSGMMIANFLSRLVFRTATKRDSRWMIDGRPDAEQLLGNGDALFLAPDSRNPIFLQTHKFSKRT